jgi:hypothetical protein
MLLKPSPAPLDGPLRSERDIAKHRRLYCPHYDRCLDESIRLNWQGFTCSRCPLSENVGKGPRLGPYATQRRGDRFSS